jgi:hypothetical protein
MNRANPADTQWLFQVRTRSRIITPGRCGHPQDQTAEHTTEHASQLQRQQETLPCGILPA